MAQNRIRYVGIFLIFIALIAAEASFASLLVCTIKCNIECIFIRKPLCVSDCLKGCKFQVSEAISNCTFLCTNSSCSKFTSDASEMERCLSSCYGNCIENH